MGVPKRKPRSIEPPAPVETAGEVFVDGSLLELVRDPSDPSVPALLYRKGKRSLVSSTMEVRGRKFVPFSGDAFRITRLASRILPYGSTAELFRELRSQILKFSGPDEDQATLLSFFVLSTFFPDCVAMAPSLLLLGPLLEAVAMLRVLSWLCRHATLLVDSGLRVVPARLQPTRLICATDRDVNRYLAAYQLRGFTSCSAGVAGDVSCASVFYLGERQLETVFGDLCLPLPLSPGTQLASPKDEQEQAAVIDQLQGKLLGYRARNHARVKASNFDVPAFQGYARQIARTFGACVVDDEEVRRELVEIMAPFDEAARVERFDKLESIVLEALLALCHEQRSEAYVGQIADLANGILSRSGEPLLLSPKEAGGKLKRLGIRTVRLNADGRGVYLLAEIRRRVHQLAKSYELPSLQQGGLPGCPECQALKGA